MPIQSPCGALRLAVACAIGAAFSAGCTSTAAPVSQTAMDRQLSLEQKLDRLPPSTSADRTVARAVILRGLGRQSIALEELSLAIEAARTDLDWGDLGSLWRARGAIEMEQGRAEKALETFGQRLKAAVSLGHGTARASALVDTAWAFAALGHVGQADEALTEAMVLGKSHIMSDPASVERIGWIAQRLNDAERSHAHLTEASRLYRSRGDAASAARAAVHAAHVLARFQRQPTALDAVAREAQASDDPEPEMLLRLYQSEQDLLSLAYDRCETRANQAVVLADRRGVLQVAKLARVIAARCASKSGHLKDAIEHATAAGAIIDEQLRHVAGDVARQELGFEALQVYRLLLSLQVQQDRSDAGIARAFETSERARGRAHLDAVARSQVGALAGVMPVSPALERDQAAAEERVRRLTQALVVSRSRRGLAERHRDALWALEDIKQAMVRQNPLMSRVSLPRPATIKSVREHLLDSDSVLLSYFVAEGNVVLFAITKEAAALAVLDKSSDDIDRLVRHFRHNHLLRPDAGMSQTRQAARTLFDDLIGPASELVESKKRLIVIPHGALSSLPFESLVGPDNRFVVESHEVRYGLSSTLALELQRRRSDDRQSKLAFVGIGDPVYDWEAYRAGKREGLAAASARGLELWNEAEEGDTGSSRGLSRLPGTAVEVRTIAKLFGTKHKTYLRAKANEAAVKGGALTGARIVHIASHGLMAPHYQALALTLDPGAAEDGFLMASEIAELELSADLVVLSACRTGNTRQREAEPVAGLALSLRSAGADQVVLSLWSVDDDATAQLMIDFYRPLAASSRDYGASLADSKRAMIDSEQWSHPYYWAAFVLLGI